MSLRVNIATFMILVASTTAAMSQEVPNLVGTWSGKMVGGAYFGELSHVPATKEPVFVDRMMEWTLTIDKQDGSGLIGTWATKTMKETLVGVIRQDNVTVKFADDDTIFDARLLTANEIEMCAQEDMMSKGGATIATCFILKRQ